MYFERFPTVTRRAMSRALNDTARDHVLRLGRAQIYAEVAFPRGYLDDRLWISRYSAEQTLEVRVSGRDRPTSLARFTRPGTPLAKKGRQAPNLGITATVTPGQPKFFASGFLVGLNHGNVGFALRLRVGETVRSVDRYQPIQLWPGVFLLYGPSVNQMWESVSGDIAPEVTSKLEDEFLRQFGVLTQGGL